MTETAPLPPDTAGQAACADVEQAICQAIHDKRIISFSYEGCTRLAEPHDFGISKGRRRLFYYQVGGESRSGHPFGWRWAELSKISAVQLFQRRFPGTRATATQRHHSWDELIATVSPREQPR